MEGLTLENIVDLREAVARRLKELQGVDLKGHLPETRKEHERRTRSLAATLSALEMRAKDLTFETTQLPFCDHDYRMIGDGSTGRCVRCGKNW